MKKFENVRAYNFQNAVRASHNDDKSWNETDSEFGLCELNDIPTVINRKFVKYGIGNFDDHETILEYRNVIIWNYGNGLVEFALIGPDDLGLLKSHLDKLIVSYDVNIDNNVATYIKTYADLKDIYEKLKDTDNDILKMIKDIPYAQDLIINN